MSDVICLVVDVRHPFFHFPISLYDYITNTLKKPLVLVLNKVDLVPVSTVVAWIDFFKARFPNIAAFVPFSVKFGGDLNKSKKYIFFI